MAETKISAGSYDLNKWLYGGYETDIITTIYGPSGSGKTNFCILTAVSQAKKSKKVIFIDSEGGFSVERVKQISGDDYESVMNNILVMKPTNFSEQKKAFDSLLKEINSNSNIGVIIIDSMTMLYRLEIADNRDDKKNSDNHIREVNRELANQLRTLSEISRKKLMPVLITNQIYYDFLSEEDFKSGKERNARMVGGDLLKYWSKCLIELKSENGKRTALLKKHRSLPEKELSFLITKEGIKKRGIF